MSHCLQNDSQLGTAIRSSQTSRSWLTRDNRLSGANFRDICIGLRKVGSIRTLVASRNGIGDHDCGLYALLDLLRVSGLEEVVLSSNGIRDRSSAVLCMLLQQLPSRLNSLDLSENQLTNKTGYQLLKVLTQRQAWCKLDLSLNKISPSLQSQLSSIKKIKKPEPALVSCYRLQAEHTGPTPSEQQSLIYKKLLLEGEVAHFSQSIFKVEQQIAVRKVQLQRKKSQAGCMAGQLSELESEQNDLQTAIVRQRDTLARKREAAEQLTDACLSRANFQSQLKRKLQQLKRRVAETRERQQTELEQREQSLKETTDKHIQEYNKAREYQQANRQAIFKLGQQRLQLKLQFQNHYCLIAQAISTKTKQRFEAQVSKLELRIVAAEGELRQTRQKNHRLEQKIAKVLAQNKKAMKECSPQLESLRREYCNNHASTASANLQQATFETRSEQLQLRTAVARLELSRLEREIGQLDEQISNRIIQVITEFSEEREFAREVRDYHAQRVQLLERRIGQEKERAAGMREGMEELGRRTTERSRRVVAEVVGRHRQ